MIIRTNPVLHNYVIFCPSLQIILKNHKNFLTLKCLQNTQSSLVINQNDRSLGSFINRVLIRNRILNLIIGLVMIDQNCQSSNHSSFISLIRISTNSSFNQKNKFPFGLWMLQFLTTINIIVLSSQHLNLIFLLIRNGTKSTHRILQSTLNPIEIKRLFK